MSGLIHSNRDVFAFLPIEAGSRVYFGNHQKNRQGAAYTRALLRAAQKYAPSIEMSSILSDDKGLEVRKYTQPMLQGLANLMLKDLEVLPDPTWVGHHGMLPEGVFPEMVPSNQFADIRKQFIFDNLNLISN